jgi:hypothetical protein
VMMTFKVERGQRDRIPILTTNLCWEYVDRVDLVDLYGVLRIARNHLVRLWWWDLHPLLIC